jgi:hypothetical protein
MVLFHSRFWAGALSSYGPTAGWQIRPHSRHVTSGDRAGPNDDSHPPQQLIGTDPARNFSLVVLRGAGQEPIAVVAGSALPGTVQEPGNLRRRSHQRQLKSTFCDENHLYIG